MSKKEDLKEAAAKSMEKDLINVLYVHLKKNQKAMQSTEDFLRTITVALYSFVGKAVIIISKPIDDAGLENYYSLQELVFSESMEQTKKVIAELRKEQEKEKH